MKSKLETKMRGLVATASEYVGRNPTGSILLVVAFIVAVGVMAMQGCSIDTFVKVRVPDGVQKSIGVPAKIPLRDAFPAFEKFKADVTRDSAQFADNIESARFLSRVFDSLLDTGLTLGQAGAENSGIPMGGLLSLGLGLMGGLALEKPGTQKRTTAEKTASFNEGLTEGKDIVLASMKE